MNTIFEYTVTGLIESSKLLVRGIRFLANGTHDLALDMAVIKVESMDIDTKLELVEKYKLQGAEKVLESLRRNLEEVQNAINNHKQKWFTRYRTFDVTLPLMNLEKDVAILTSRLLFKHNTFYILEDTSDNHL